MMPLAEWMKLQKEERRARLALDEHPDVTPPPRLRARRMQPQKADRPAQARARSEVVPQATPIVDERPTDWRGERLDERHDPPQYRPFAGGMAE